MRIPFAASLPLTILPLTLLRFTILRFTIPCSAILRLTILPLTILRLADLPLVRLRVRRLRLARVPLASLALILLPLAAPLAEDVGSDLRIRVGRAIESGRKSLLGQMDRLLEATPSDYPIGRLALPVAALLRSGVPSTHASVRAALARLERLPLEKTYCVSCYLLALSSLCDRIHEEALSGAEPWKSPPSRKATGKVRARMEELVAWLVAAQNAGHGSWTYEKAEGGRKHDFSNTQFAALGLEVALEHDIAVPRETFARLAACFSRALIPAPAAVDVEISREIPVEERLRATATSPVRRYRAVPGGWAYVDSRASRIRPTAKAKEGKASAGKANEEPVRTNRASPYASMTAAGASSLLIAARGLGGGFGGQGARGGAGDPRGPGGRGGAGSPGVAGADVDAAIHAAYAWIAVHFDDYLAGGKNLHYTLYSLEKVGDLGGIETFGGRAWYDEGAGKLLALEGKDGGWGSYVNTSLALLFLTRATRVAEVSAAPVLYTGEGEKSPGGHDLVYIDRLKGFVSARGLLRYAGEARRPELLQACEEAVRNYPPDFVDELVPDLLLLWKGPDRVTSFAQGRLAAITGLRSSRPEEYGEWLRQLETVRALETRDALEPEEVAAAIRGTTSPRIKARGATLAGRKGLRALGGLLIEELAVASVEYRRALHGVLTLWATPPVPAPLGDDPAAWARVAAAWQAWGREHRSEIEAGSP